MGVIRKYSFSAISQHRKLVRDKLYFLAALKCRAFKEYTAEQILREDEHQQQPPVLLEDFDASLVDFTTIFLP